MVARVMSATDRRVARLNQGDSRASSANPTRPQSAADIAKAKKDEWSWTRSKQLVAVVMVSACCHCCLMPAAVARLVKCDGRKRRDDWFTDVWLRDDVTTAILFFLRNTKKKLMGFFFGGGFGLSLISEIMEAWAYMEALPEGSWSGRHGVCD